ncbi:hypothetical protein BU23DRAFT_572647 [Bimuria novae-zelandiae CBS 107.79]|uniref:Uncharacterized protein n=1 Tax=Bimuria novae-zelandiae CBS 107.79 TaxID=1447943 RepID=A0A6A5UVX0_9PLEO|nr:hypothetical protein BU23DRAFT_572647 [Bimuria novae-zelandiae CBS 107.79]
MHSATILVLLIPIIGTANVIAVPPPCCKPTLTGPGSVFGTVTLSAPLAEGTEQTPGKNSTITGPGSAPTFTACAPTAEGPGQILGEKPPVTGPGSAPILTPGAPIAKGPGPTPGERPTVTGPGVVLGTFTLSGPTAQPPQ